ncbi:MULTISPECIES: Na(+)/H(+) antiporter subunit C [Thermomonosporaceae]|uniref:Na(+)/H(+) antiporter subunit C n=1 Tax=Thermomonosporaceae TaxID=2012 RepID=UPI00255B3C34|nr:MULTISPECIES: Na(+)/H(+) antiporter subunit C [Thermomonosporaceae]MDL4770576.1 Na(+)/H(+) antiporter subunit C [Actinomadura xylanilytica]
MSGTVVLAAAGGALVAAGVALVLERSLSRLVVGMLVLGNGVNLLILTGGGPAGRAPILHGVPPGADRRPMNDPVPQAMILTAIVIALGTAAFALAIAYRSGRLGDSDDDDVRDDIEDRRVTRGRHELRTQVRARRREFREWSREQRGQIRGARRELRAGIRAERERRAVDDPGDLDDGDDESGSDR